MLCSPIHSTRPAIRDALRDGVSRVQSDMVVPMHDPTVSNTIVPTSTFVLEPVITPDEEMSSLEDSLDSECTVSVEDTESPQTYEYCARLPGTSELHYVGHFEEHNDSLLVAPQPRVGDVTMSRFASSNQFASLTNPPPTSQRAFLYRGERAVLTPTALSSIDESEPATCWSSICCKRRRSTRRGPRRTQTVYDFTEINAELDSLDKESRTTMRRGKNLKRLQTQGGIFESVAQTAAAINTIADKADLIQDLSQKIDATQNFLKYGGSSDLVDNLMSRLEDLTAFIIGLRSTTNWENCAALIHLYLRGFFPHSVTITLLKWVFNALKLKIGILETQGGLEFDTSCVGTTIASFKNIISNWKVFRNSDLARNLANVVDILVSTGFVTCDDPKKMKNPFRTPEFEKFSTRVWDIQSEAIDFTSMVFETIIFFLERGYVAFVHKDPTLLLYSDSETHLMDMEYSLLASALPLLECGRLDELADRMNAMPLNGVKPIVDSADFDNRVDVMIMKISYLLKFEKHPAARSQLSSKLTVMSKLRTAMIMQQRLSPIRDKPFCIEIFGGSSVAKTTLCNIFARVILHHNGFACTKDHIVTCNDLDKYQSEYTSAKTAVVLDDYGNTRAEHYDVPPVTKIIDFCNNVTKAALNAEVEKKGNVMIRPKMVLLTTNVKGLMADQFSNEPVSIQRRFEVIVTAKLRKEYTDPATGGPLIHKMNDSSIPDAWELLLETVHIVRGTVCDKAELRSVFTKKNAQGLDVPTTVGIFEALAKMKEMSQLHFESQRKYVSCVEDFFTIDFCEHSLPPKVCPECCACKSAALENKPEPPFSLDDALPHWKSPPSEDDETMWQNCQSDIKYVPHAGTESDAERNIRANEILKDFTNLDDDFETIDVYGGVRSHSGRAISYDEDSEDTFVDYFADRRARLVAGGVALATCVGALYMVYRIYRTMHKTVEVQGDVISQPVKLETDVANPWKTVRPVELPVSLASKTTTVSDLISLLSRKTGFVLVRPQGSTEERKVSDIVPMCGDRWLMPFHMVKDPMTCYELEIRTHKNGELSKTFHQIVSSREIERIPDTDYVVVRLANGGDNFDLSKFLLTGKVELGWTRSKLYAKTVLRKPDGSTELETIHVHTRQNVETEVGKYEAYCYNYPRPTYTGQCMMSLITDSASPALLGFHLAGLTGEAFGAAGVILKQWFDEANSKLSSRMALKCHSSGTFRTTQYGESFSPVPNIDPRHSTLWMSRDIETNQEPSLEVYGSHPRGTSRFKSNVRKSVISDFVAEIMQLPRLHGPPNGTKSWSHWQRDLDLISKPKGMFKPEILFAAASDFKRKIKTLMSEKPEMIDLIHPYDLDTILAGVDGITSVDGVDLKTSMGWPLNKPKTHFIVPSERVVPNVTRPLDIDPIVLEEVEKVEAILASGERCYSIFRGTKKDEAVKFTKDKIRIFAGAPYSLTHVTRKYYLPLIRFIQTNWKYMECAVGINAHGVQWDELAEWLSVHGRERMVAGDFKNYDKCISPTIMTEAFGILIFMAREAGYNEDQIRIMEGIATEICYPFYEWDGVFIQAFGSNPSGHPLTVIVNNLANSLYMRYAYYAMHAGEQVPDFAERVQLVCYGDDNTQCVHPEETKYNFNSVSTELGKIGVIYTPADKVIDKDSPDFIPFEEVSFLKRGFLYREDLQLWVAPLEEASISKSLHNYLHHKGSPVLPPQIAGQVISGAIREYFRYPREFFEMRREQLIEVAKRSDVLAYIPKIPTYQDLKDELTGVNAVPCPSFPTWLECA